MNRFARTSFRHRRMLPGVLLLGWVGLLTGGTRPAITVASLPVPGVQANPPGERADVPSTGPAAPADRAANSAMEGQALFRGLCSGCHGGAGRGGKGPDLTDNRWIHGSTDEDIVRVIANGVPKTTMKKMGDSLKPDQIHKLIAIHPQPGALIGREHLEALRRRRFTSGAETILRFSKQGPVREVPCRGRRRGSDRSRSRSHRQSASS